MTLVAATQAQRPAFAQELTRLAILQGLKPTAVNVVNDGYDVPPAVAAAFVTATANANFATAVRVDTVEELAVLAVVKPVSPTTIAAVTAPGAAYVQAEAASAKTAIDQIRTALSAAGIVV